MDPATIPRLHSSSPSPVTHDSSPSIVQTIESDYDSAGPSVSSSGSGRHSSGIDEAVFDVSPTHSARHASPETASDFSDDDLISELPSPSRATSCAASEIIRPHLRDHQHAALPYTPPKTRSPFRNPSSVRGMQLDTTPPHLRSPTQRSRYSQNHAPRMSTGSRTSTPRSTKSYHRSLRSPPTAKGPPKKEHPLVLLHLTILPIVCPYLPATMEGIAPEHLLQNWNLLKEKVPETVLERGILIPHPCEDYEMLEERLLESLELKVPRLLKCGHFHNDDIELFSGSCSSGISQNGEGDGRAEEYDGDAEDVDICDDCGRRVRDGAHGSAGSGKRRWDIRIYAANGLMRAGAWSAAWREMERVDVEFCPWMEDNVRCELDLRKVQEEDDRRAEEEMHHASAAARLASASGRESVLDEERRREIYGVEPAQVLERDQAFIDGFGEPAQTQHAFDHPSEQKFSASESPVRSHPRVGLRSQKAVEIPLKDLLKNYVHLLLQGPKNVVIALLSLFVIFLALHGTQSSQGDSVQLASPTTASSLTEMHTAHAAAVLDDISHSSIGTPTPFSSAEADDAAVELSTGKSVVGAQLASQSTPSVDATNEAMVKEAVWRDGP